MNKNILFGIVIFCTIAVVLFTFSKKKTTTGSSSSSQTGQMQSSSMLSTQSQQSQQNSVPLPQETDIIRTFFNLIEERKISEAVLMMSDAITQNDSTKQAWGVQLNAMKSVKIISIDPSMQEEWTDTQHSYKVVVDIIMSPDSANAVIPYYGYDNGKNYRWITLEKEGIIWKISGLATGP